MFKKKQKEVKNITLSKDALSKELSRVKYKSKFSSILRSTIYTIVIIAAASAIIATLIMPVIQISGTSMNPNYKNGDIVVTLKTKGIYQGDVVAFYYGNKILVKRVVGTQSNWVNIDRKGNVEINGYKIEEDYLSSKAQGDYDISFPCQVPAESYFVLSDDRLDTSDSRSQDIGFISQENIIGKVLFKVWPLN